MKVEQALVLAASLELMDADDKKPTRGKTRH